MGKKDSHENPICFSVLKVFKKKIKFFLVLLDILILKIIFKK